MVDNKKNADAMKSELIKLKKNEELSDDELDGISGGSQPAPSAMPPSGGGSGSPGRRK